MLHNESSEFETEDGMVMKYFGMGGVVVVPDGVEAIDGGAFRGCAALTKIVIPKTLRRIHTMAFAGCSSLKEICFGGSKAAWSRLKKGDDWDKSTGDYSIFSIIRKISLAQPKQKRAAAREAYRKAVASPWHACGLAWMREGPVTKLNFNLERYCNEKALRPFAKPYEKLIAKKEKPCRIIREDRPHRKHTYSAPRKPSAIGVLRFNASKASCFAYKGFISFV